MAVAYSNSGTDLTNGVTSRNTSVTVASGETRLVALLYLNQNNGTNPSATYNSVAMTRFTLNTNLYAFEIVNPTVGTANIAFNWTGSDNPRIIWATYTGSDTALAIARFDSASASSAGSVTASYTSITGYSVLFMFADKGATSLTLTAGTGSTLRSAVNNGSTTPAAIFDSNATTAGSYSMTANSSDATTTTLRAIIFTVPQTNSLTQSDTNVSTDSLNYDMSFSQSDTSASTDTAGFAKWQTTAKSTPATWTNEPKS